MKVICAEAAAESFAVFASGFPVPGETVPAGAASGRGSNVAKGSRRAVESGFPRRRRGRFGSSIGSLEAEADAEVDAEAFGVAGAFAASDALGALAGGAGVGGGAGPAGFCWSFLSLPLSDLSLSVSVPLSESALSLRR